MMTPIPMFTPEMLAEMAKAGFRPPAATAGPGLSMPTSGGTPGFNVADGLAGLGMGLAAIRDPASRKPAGWVPSTSGSEPGRTLGDTDLGGYGASPVDPMSGNPNAQPFEVFNPSGAVGAPDFLTGIWRKLFG